MTESTDTYDVDGWTVPVWYFEDADELDEWLTSVGREDARILRSVYRGVDGVLFQAERVPLAAFHLARGWPDDDSEESQ